MRGRWRRIIARKFVESLLEIIEHPAHGTGIVQFPGIRRVVLYTEDNMRTSYHCHTTLTHGESTVSDFVHAAISAGLDEVGISEHYTLVPGKVVTWSMPPSGLPEYFRILEAARKEAGNKVKFRFGLEADYIPESVAQLGQSLKQYPLDYVIGSVHYVGDFLTDESPDAWNEIAQDKRNEIMRRYWGCITEMAKSGVFDIVGHLELYKKFGHKPTIDLSSDISTALDAIAMSGMAVELNTSGWHYIGECYPSPTILSECKRRGIPTLVTMDAHHVDNITRYYDRGVAQLKEVGYAQQAIFSGRTMSLADY